MNLINDDLLLKTFIVTGMDPCVPRLRVAKKDARRWLLENKSIIIGGTVRHFAFRHIGLGIYEMDVRPIEKRETVILTD